MHGKPYVTHSAGFEFYFQGWEMQIWWLVTFFFVFEFFRRFLSSGRGLVTGKTRDADNVRRGAWMWLFRTKLGISHVMLHKVFRALSLKQRWSEGKKRAKTNGIMMSVFATEHVNFYTFSFCMWSTNLRFGIIICDHFTTLLLGPMLNGLTVRNRKCWIYNKVIFIVISRSSASFDQDSVMFGALGWHVWLQQKKVEVENMQTVAWGRSEIDVNSAGDNRQKCVTVESWQNQQPSPAFA